MRGGDKAMNRIIRIVKFIAFISSTFSLLTTTFAASIGYQYDNLNRLRMEKYEDGRTKIYEYDEVGNRTSNYATQFTAMTQAGSASPSGSITIQEGFPRTVYFTPIPHYHVSNVIVDGTSKGAISSYSFQSVPAPQTIQAQFAIDRFNLRVYSWPWSTGGGKTISSIPGIDCGVYCSESYDYGTFVTLTAIPDEKSKFSGWYGYCGGLGLCTLFMDSSKYVYADFTLKTFYISTNTVYTEYYSPTQDPYAKWGIGGAIEPFLSEVTYDGYKTFTITPNSGNKITNVIIDGQSIGAVSSYTFLNVKAPHSITAQFYFKYNNPVPINIYLNNTDGVNVTSPSGIYCGMGATTCSKVFDFGTIVKLTATSNIGYYGGCFSGVTCLYNNTRWVYDENGIFTIIQDCIINTTTAQNITCSYYPLYIFPINANPMGAGSITPPGRTYTRFGWNKTYTITPSNGATIEDVIVDGVSVGPVSSYAFNNISSSHNITAKFSCPNLPVRLARGNTYCGRYGCWTYYYLYSYHTTLQAAYDASISGDKIETVEGLVDNLNANRDIYVTVEGGYDCNYTSSYGKTTVMKGTMTTTAGTVSLWNFTLF
jgi:hypothetical protein